MGAILGKHTAPDGAVKWVELACDADGKLLTAGASTSGGDASAANQTLQLAQDTAVATAVGVQADAAATDSGSAWSVVALLKGILARLLGTLSVGGTAAAGTVPSMPPLSVSGVDGGGLKRHLLTDVAGRQVVVAAPPIEAHTNIGALAASATAYSDPIDLGPAATRQHTRCAVQKIGLVSAGETLQLLWSADGINWYGPAPSALGSSSSATAWTNASNASMHTQCIPIGRYVRALYTNGSTAQTALLIAVVAIAGI